MNISLKPELQKRDYFRSVSKLPFTLILSKASNRSHYCMLTPCCLYSRWVAAALSECPPEITACQKETGTREGSPVQAHRKNQHCTLIRTAWQHPREQINGEEWHLSMKGGEHRAVFSMKHILSRAPDQAQSNPHCSEPVCSQSDPQHSDPLQLLSVYMKLP